MVSGRPFLYLSLPGVAFILGVFWFRRRNKNRLASSGGKKEKLNEEMTTKTVANGSVKTNTAVYPTPTKCININGSVSNDNEIRLFGKSAPIQIVKNGRGTSPAKHSQQQIDSEELKSKIQNAEHKLLSSIDEDFENLSSPVDLPDTFDDRMLFYARTVDVKKEKPVVVVATTTPKISPKNSFMESNCTKESEENNNFDDSKISEDGNNDGASAISTTNTTFAVKSEETNVIAKEDVEDTKKPIIVDNTELEATNVNDKRNVDAASPSLSLCSVQTGDSGKGSSLPRSEATRAKSTYEFFIPNSLVGQLYGRKRSYINFIKTKTNASVILRQRVSTDKLRVCAIEGTESEIQAALALIRQRLPAKRYPNLTMQKIHFALPQTVVPLPTESLLNLQLNLIEGINNDIVVSAIISGGHLFVQHPLHPSHPSLAILQKCLYVSYTTSEAPLLPGIELNAVCVMPVNGIWYRVQIVDQDTEDTNRCVIKFLDFGGYMSVHLNELRQIRSDFMNVPFQATECMLSNVEPIDNCWSAEAAETLAELTKGIVLQAQVAGYNSENIPEILVFASLGPNNVIFLNKELVARNLAKWVDIKD